MIETDIGADILASLPSSKDDDQPAKAHNSIQGPEPHFGYSYYDDGTVAKGMRGIEDDEGEEVDIDVTEDEDKVGLMFVKMVQVF